MLKRILFFVLGLLVGYLFDLVPHVFEVVADTNVCVESCSALLKGVSTTAYIAMPITWGILFATMIGKPYAKKIIFTFALFSLTLMMLLTWFLYAHQHP